MANYLSTEKFRDLDYYTPTLDEFHVGFEYEVQDVPDGGEFVTKSFTRWSDSEYHAWVKSCIENVSFNALAPIFYRVKFLTKIDIENLGWVFTWNELSELHYAMKCTVRGMPDSTIYLRHIPMTKHVLIRFDIEQRNKEFLRSPILFSGMIKNKSELINVMNQLQINV